MSGLSHNPRRLVFASLDDVMPEVERLLWGHQTVGKWTLGQICNHLEMAIRLSIDGYPQRAPWLLRVTVGPLIVKRVLAKARFPRGVRLPERFAPVPGLDAQKEAEGLRSTLTRYRAHSGPLAPHPLTNRISRPEWDQFHAIHCAHHLGFALPDGSG